MADLLDYLLWRGDLPFSKVPLGAVDSLILTTLSYIHFDDIVPTTPGRWISLEDAAKAFLKDPKSNQKIRVEQDLELLAAAAASNRFRRVWLSFYRNVFIPEEDTQFCAMTWYLEDGSAVLTFRGTDYTLVGWREDFNMAFMESVPAQRLALAYVQEFAAKDAAPMYLAGHSKGGNLAIYAAAKCEPEIQDRIQWVYNHDGPGFMDHFLQSPGYQRIIPKIRSYLPQASVFGLMLHRQEPHTIICSRQIGLLQHDPHSWEVLGNDFVQADAFTADSQFINRTFKIWLAGMSQAERNAFFDTVFDLLMSEEVPRPLDILRPQNLKGYVKTLKSDAYARRIIATEMANLLRSAKSAQKEP